MIFDFAEWYQFGATTKEEAKEKLLEMGIINDEIEEFIILDKDTTLDTPHFFDNLYSNEVLRDHTKHMNDEDVKIWTSKILEFRKTHDKVSLDMFPEGFKSTFSMSTQMPLILKMKSGNYIELFFDDDPPRTLRMSANQLEKYINDACPIMNYSKFYKCLLNTKIIDVNFDGLRYFKAHNYKLDDHNKISCVNIEFENGLVLMIHAIPFRQTFMIYDINAGYFKTFTLDEFKESFLGDINKLTNVFKK